MKDHDWINNGSADKFFNGTASDLYIWSCKNCDRMTLSYNEPTIFEGFVMISCLLITNGVSYVEEDESVDLITEEIIERDCNIYKIRRIMEE